MPRLLFLALISFSIIACSEDEDPKPESNKLSTIVGDHIYTVITGNNQTGYPGQTLPQEIKIVITNLNGSPVRRALQFELTDNSGQVSGSSYYPSDTINITWKLGCNAIEQGIKVIDNVCGLAKSGCIDAEIFEISASASGEIGKGWYSPCLAFDVDNYGYTPRLLVNDERVVIKVGNDIYSVEDPLDSDWKLISNPNSSGYGNYHILSNGEVFRSGSNPAITNWSNETWVNLSLPSYSSDVYIEVSENGYYYLASDYSSQVYKSNNLTNWTEAIDTYDYTYYSRPQAMASEAGHFFILASGQFVLKVDAASGNVTTYEFPYNSWDTYGDLDEMAIKVKGEKLFVKSQYSSSLKVLDLATLAVENYYVNSDSRLYKSQNEIYLMESPVNMKMWNGSSFTLKEYPELQSAYYNYNSFGVFKGSPVLFTSDGDFYYYID